jgi:zona occludens toxin (predicted ATPase)
MPRYLVIVASLILCALSSIAAAEIYKTVDKNGKITYTDVPPSSAQAKPLELKTINSLPAPPDIPISAPVNVAPDTTQDYQIQVVAPENGRTLMADERSVTVSVGLNQPLNNGALLAYKVDGDIITTTQETTYTIVEPPRGERSLTVDVVDANGRVLAQSNPVTLLVMRPIVKQKAAPVPKK